MKRLLTLLLTISILASSQELKAQSDKVVGYWLTQDSDSQIKIYKAENGKFYGKVAWMLDPLDNGKPKTDKENPKVSLRNQPILGLQLLKNFEYDADEKEWVDGEIYDPTDGKTYSCYIWFEDNDYNTLHVKGFIGFALIGREVEWKRETSLRK